jgi:hypothetical protein
MLKISPKKFKTTKFCEGNYWIIKNILFVKKINYLTNIFWSYKGKKVLVYMQTMEANS